MNHWTTNKIWTMNKIDLLIKTVFGGCLLLMVAAPIVQADEGVLYIADKVYTMDGEPLSPGQVYVVDGKIKAVGSQVDVGDAQPETVQLGAGSVLMPGLVDAYSQSGLGDDGTDEITDEVTVDFQTLRSVDWDGTSLRRQLQQGTTTICLCPGRQNVFAGVAAIVKTHAGDDEQLSVVLGDGPLVANLCSDPASGNQARSRPDSIFVRQPTNRMGVVWIMRNTFDKVKRGSADASLQNLQEVMDGKRPLLMFARMSHDLNTVSTLADEFGFSPILVGGHEAYKVREMIAERKYPVILEGTTIGSIRGPEQSEICWNQPGLLAQSGIEFAIAGESLLEQARFAVRFGLDPQLALQAITTTPAKILGLQQRVGTISAGKDADLIALTGEPLKITTSIRWVMVNGQIHTME